MEVLQRGAWLGSLLVATLLRYRSLAAPPSRPPAYRR
ncbi:hypothetical protein [Mesorhizobium sp.]